MPYSPSSTVLRGRRNVPSRSLERKTPIQGLPILTGSYAVELGPEGASFTAGGPTGDADLVLPAEALIRLVYGRLDPDHTPPFEGDGALLDELRRAYPGF